MFLLSDGTPTDLFGLVIEFLSWTDTIRLSLSYKRGLSAIKEVQYRISPDGTANVLNTPEIFTKPYSYIHLRPQNNEELIKIAKLLPSIRMERLVSLTIATHIDWLKFGLFNKENKTPNRALVKALAESSFPALESFCWLGLVPVTGTDKIFPRMPKLKHVSLSVQGSYNQSDGREKNRLLMVQTLAESCPLLETVSLQIAESQYVNSRGSAYADALKNLKNLKVLEFSDEVGAFFCNYVADMMKADKKTPKQVEKLLQRTTAWIASISPPVELKCAVYLSNSFSSVRGQSLLYHALMTGHKSIILPVLDQTKQQNPDISNSIDIITYICDCYQLRLEIWELLFEAGFDFGRAHPAFQMRCALEHILFKFPMMELFNWIFKSKYVKSPENQHEATTPIAACLQRWPRWGPFSYTNVFTTVASTFHAGTQIPLLEHLKEHKAAIEAELGISGLIGGPNEASPSGTRPIHVVRAPKVAEYLVSQEVDLYAKSVHGFTAWSLMASDRRSDALGVLLASDCSCVDGEMPEIGGTMMQKACEIGAIETIVVLHSNYARITEKNLGALLDFVARCERHLGFRETELCRVAEIAVKLPNNPRDAVPCALACAESSFQYSKNPRVQENHRHMFEALLRKLVWLMDGNPLVKLDKLLFERSKVNLAEMYMMKNEPDLAKMVLKKVSEDAEARAEAGKVWRENKWYPLHAALRSQHKNRREVELWREYVRFARILGFELEEQDCTGQTVDQLMDEDEKQDWMRLFEGSAQVSHDPWRN